MLYYFIHLLGLLMCTFSCATGNETDRPFGSCLDGKESCSECYLSLKKSLLSRDDNILNLSLAFYPPQSNIPEFVSITYLFGEATSSNSTSQEWFWTHDSSYLLFPLPTFQYHSLFFGKLEKVVSQTLTLTLDAECSTAPNKNMELLTQRLKDFIEQKKYNPQIDQNYFAKALLSKGDILDLSTANLINVFYVLGSIFTIIIAAMMIVMYLYSKRWDTKLKRLEPLSNSNRHARSKIYGVASTGLLWNVYILVLDIVALYALQSAEKEETKLKPLPIITLIFTGIGLVLSIICWCLSIICCVSETIKKYKFIFLAFSVLGPTYAVICHLPYIAIAFLNDAYHASSTFIFYTIATFVLFATFDFTIGICQVGLIYALSDNTFINKITSCNPKLRVSINDQSHEVDATLCITGIQINKLLEILQKKEELQVPLTRLRFCQIPNTNITQGSRMTLRFGENSNQANTEVKCQLISKRMQESTRAELTVRNNNLVVTVDRVEHSGGYTTIMFKTDVAQITIVGGSLITDPLHCCPLLTKTKKGNMCIYSFVIPLFVALVLVLIVLIACVLTFVPINDAFSDAPNRLVGFYQSVLILLGAYIVYKNYFKKKPSVESAIKKRRKHIPTDRVTTDDEWKELSKDERVAAFYSRIVDLVARYPDS